MTTPVRLVWLRNDLRLTDNPALTHACRDDAAVVLVVTLTPESWHAHGESLARMGLWNDQLRSLLPECERLNLPLRVLHLQRFADCAPALADLAQQLGAAELCFNYEYPLNERNRDAAVCRALERVGVSSRAFHGELIIPPGQVLTGQGGMFKVYTPFGNAWRRRLIDFDSPVIPCPSARRRAVCASEPLPADLDYGAIRYRRDIWPVGEAHVSERLNTFVQERVQDYARKRDFPQTDPAGEGTSRLSPYLSIGALSPRQCLAALRAENDDPDWLHSSWLNELIWREFYRHLLVAYPGLSRLEPFRPEVEARISWQQDDPAFQAWCRGETGFPIVDAAMKQLLDTGWMHNRLRMIVASFLTKLLRVDWRLGADFFMRHLIDGDFASNLGGWQWSSSVGADAAPYFRIFNPQVQGEKFDPNGTFVAHWLPELRDIEPGKARQRPGAGSARGRPEPIIDYKQARQTALDDYQSGG
ncbi:deoxyribodipyrimidine photo-lyase [Marinobacterium zhoushanense]|uniref:Deoxyribodipyrimidine photo-lyase n=1 Tax=Marinobacterium zhoushanense TaxID=1679163 RepID=A0ABQ1K0G5_9GAMM|nr:deoxyribodipyrimidine photo-lyase [Marinobacterium zhoushanense]GGB80415.1 deoxyribodipyrimidine photo-lyase [Marinobacterium zhoushanense]